MCFFLLLLNCKSRDYIEKISSLRITNFLISRGFKQVSYKLRKDLISSYMQLLEDPDVETRFVLCENLLTLSNQPEFLEQINTDSSFETDFVINFVISQCAIFDEEIESASNSLPSPPFETTLYKLKRRGQFVLENLTQNPRNERLVWPLILEYINNQKKSPALPTLLRSISQFIRLYREEFKHYPPVQQKSLPHYLVSQQSQSGQ